MHAEVGAVEEDEEVAEDALLLVGVVEAVVEEEEDLGLVVAEVGVSVLVAKTAEGRHREIGVRCLLAVRLLDDRPNVVRTRRAARLQEDLRKGHLTRHRVTLLADHLTATRGRWLVVRVLRVDLRNGSLTLRVVNLHLRVVNLQNVGNIVQGPRRLVEVVLHLRLRSAMDMDGISNGRFQARLLFRFRPHPGEVVQIHRKSSTSWTTTLRHARRAVVRKCRLRQFAETDTSSIRRLRRPNVATIAVTVRMNSSRQRTSRRARTMIVNNRKHS